MVRVLGASGAEVVLCMFIVNHLHLSSVVCLSHSPSYHVVTTAPTDESTSRNDATEYDAEAVTSDAIFVTSSHRIRPSHVERSQLSQPDAPEIDETFYLPDTSHTLETSRLQDTSRTVYTLRHSDASETVKMLHPPHALKTVDTLRPPDTSEIMDKLRPPDTSEIVETILHPDVSQTVDSLRYRYSSKSKSVIFSSDQKTALKMSDHRDFLTYRLSPGQETSLSTSPHSKALPQLYFGWWKGLFTDFAQPKAPDTEFNSGETVSIRTEDLADKSRSNDSGGIRSGFNDTLKGLPESGVNSNRDQSESSETPDDQSKSSDTPRDRLGPISRFKDQSKSSFIQKEQSESSDSSKRRSKSRDTPRDQSELRNTVIQQKAGVGVSAEAGLRVSAGGNRDVFYRLRPYDPQPYTLQPQDPQTYSDLNSDAEDVRGMTSFTLQVQEEELGMPEVRTREFGVPKPVFATSMSIPSLGKFRSLPLKRTNFLTDRFAEGVNYAPYDDLVEHGIRPKREAVPQSGDAVGDGVTTDELRQRDVSSQHDSLSSESSRLKIGSSGTLTKAPRFKKDVAGGVTSSDIDVTTDVPSGSAPSVDAVFDFIPARDIDNTRHITEAEIKYNIRRDLSAPTTSDPSLDFLPSTVGDGLDLEEPKVVKIGVILPFSGLFPWVIQKTYPALQLAVERVVRLEILANRTLELVLRDSFCSETYGPLQGIDLYVEKAAHVFVGPACDYAVAPLARFSFRWQIPILTAGALVSAFQDRREYRLLTRVQVWCAIWVKTGLPPPREMYLSSLW